MIRLDYDGDVDMANIRPFQHARTKGHADGYYIRKQRGSGGAMIRLDHDGDVEMADIRPSRSKGYANGDIQRQQGGGGLIRLDHDRDVEMADIRPSQHAKAKGHADSDIRWQQGGGGMIQVDHDGDVEMADIRPSRHARAKRHADSDIRRQQGGGSMIRVDHDGDVEMAGIRPSRHARTKSMLKFVGGRRAGLKPWIQTWTKRRQEILSTDILVTSQLLESGNRSGKQGRAETSGTNLDKTTVFISKGYCQPT
jgi:hypothetical protein